jgi:lipoyl-dependent peroxiredoxin subunit D
MSFESLRQLLPDTAKDTRVNLGIVASSTALSPRQAHLVALACAAATGEARLIEATRGESAAHLDAAHVDAATAAATIMAMNNVYYATMPARLRMQVIGKPGIDALDFELACLAVSAIGGCEKCVVSHEHAIKERSGTKEQVHEAVRIASVIASAASALRSASPAQA